MSRPPRRKPPGTGTPDPGPADALAPFGPATRGWFEARFPAATEVQRRGWPRIAAGEHALLVTLTGSGKTLAAFLQAIDRLTRLPADAPAGVRVLYVSPLTGGWSPGARAGG